jgi:rhodanese-related sulfurtransferase
MWSRLSGGRRLRAGATCNIRAAKHVSPTMNWRKHFLEAATLIAAAVICALVANAVASRERKLAVVKTSGGQPPSAVPVAPVVQTPPPAPDSGGPLSSTPPPATETRQPVTKKAPPKPEKTFSPHPDKPYIEIHGDDVVGLHKKGVLFLDARRTSVYEQGHIAGARPFSVWESDVDDKVNKLFAERSDPREQALPIVIYCSGGDCEDSHMLAQKLWGIQFNNVYVYKDGFPDWQKRGEAIHTGSQP